MEARNRDVGLMQEEAYQRLARRVLDKALAQYSDLRLLHVRPLQEYIRRIVDEMPPKEHRASTSPTTRRPYLRLVEGGSETDETPQEDTGPADDIACGPGLDDR